MSQLFSRRAAAVVLVAALVVASLAGCAASSASGAASSASGAGQAANERGSVAVDGSQITVRLDDDMKDGYTWQASVADGIVQNTQAAAEDEADKATFVYSVGADVDSSIEFYYVNDDDPSDVKYAETLSVKSDADDNPTTVELTDAEGGSAVIKRQL